jgi:predicted XRE-type DNA-binding protein
MDKLSDTSFDNFMQEQRLYVKAKTLASKKLLVEQFKAEMKKQGLNKTDMAEKMKTSRVGIDNILNLYYNNRIDTIIKFALTLGKNITISIEDR